MSEAAKHFDVVVIGGGAAGLMCALTAGDRGRRVLVLDHANRVGKKILMSGGGRCNFTNMYCEPENFISANPHFVKSALSRYSQWDFIALVEKHGIPYHEKKLGQLFCDHSSAVGVAVLRVGVPQPGGRSRRAPARGRRSEGTAPRGGGDLPQAREFHHPRRSARAADIEWLLRHAQDEVQRQFGVHLEPEVRVLGRPGATHEASEGTA